MDLEMFNVSVYEAVDKLLLEISQGAQDTIARNCNLLDFIYGTEVINNLLKELDELEYKDEYRDKKINIRFNPMGALYYEDVEED